MFRAVAGTFAIVLGLTTTGSIRAQWDDAPYIPPIPRLRPAAPVYPQYQYPQAQYPQYPQYQYPQYQPVPQQQYLPAHHNHKGLERHIEARLRQQLCHCGVKDVDVDLDCKCRRIEVDVEVRKGVCRRTIHQQVCRILHCMPELQGYRVKVDIDD